jgi:steroid delta-isomerase-like uncharacterized protein
MSNEFAEQLFAAWNSHDPDNVLALCNDDVSLEDVPSGITYHGKTELRAFVEKTLSMAPDFQVEVIGSFICNGRGVAQTLWSGTERGLFGTGKKFSVRAASVFELRDGRMSRNTDYWDFATFMRQAGVLPTRTSGSSA